MLVKIDCEFGTRGTAVGGLTGSTSTKAQGYDREAHLEGSSRHVGHEEIKCSVCGGKITLRKQGLSQSSRNYQKNVKKAVFVKKEVSSFLYNHI